ncbi:MAG: GAF domain-containing protein [Anaerolineales bacterium]
MQTNPSTFQTIEEFRSELLKRSFFIVSIVGSPLLILAIPTTPFPIVILYFLVYFAVLALTIFPVPYRYRAFFAVALFYLLGVGNFLEQSYSSAFLSFLALITLAFLWLSRRWGWVITALSALTVAFFAWQNVQAANYNPDEILRWLALAFSLIFLASLVSHSALFLLSKLEMLLSQTLAQREELEKRRASLEEQVAARTAELKRRTIQLTAAIQVVREAALERDISYLVQQAVTLISKHFGYYHVGLFLLDETRRYAVLQAASSEEGQRLVERGHRLEVGKQGVVGRAIAEKSAHIAQDVDLDEAYFRNPELSRTRSEIALPLITRGEIIGALDIQSEEPGAFRTEDIETLQSMADSIALALENARLFSETQLTMQQLQYVSASEMRQAWRKFGARHKIGYRYTPLGLRPLESAITFLDGSEGVEIPLQLRGQTIGILRLKRKATGQPWNEQEKDLAQQVANQVALALENARLLEETRERAERERILAEITARVRETLDMETILRRAADETRQAFFLPEVVIQILPESTPENME